MRKMSTCCVRVVHMLLSHTNTRAASLLRSEDIHLFVCWRARARKLIMHFKLRKPRRRPVQCNTRVVVVERTRY